MLACLHSQMLCTPSNQGAEICQVPSPFPGRAADEDMCWAVRWWPRWEDCAVISGAEQTLQKLFHPAAGLSETAQRFWHGFLVASALIGTIIGSVAVGKPADRLGRRATMFVLALLYLVSAVGSAFAWDWYSFVIARFIGGLAVGGASVVSPMYIAEISPARVRGRLVALAQFNIVFGILLAFLSNFLIGSLGLDKEALEWRLMFGVEAIPAAVYFALLFVTPRSPRWLVAMGREDEARAVLQRVGTDVASVGEELEEIRRSLARERDSLREPFFQAKYLKPILLAFAIAAFNQLSGINAILYYSKRIFETAGFGASASLLASVGLGTVNLIFTMMALAVIDLAGRKKLMLFGSIGYIISLSATAAAFYSQSQLVQNEAGEMVRQISSTGGWIVLASLIVFIASHAFGQGAVIWVFISEVFPNQVRARGQALGSFTHWAFNAAISWTFPVSQSGARPRPGPGQFHPLGLQRRHLLDVPADCRSVRRARVRLLCAVHGGAVDLGDLRDARDQGHSPGKDAKGAGHRMSSRRPVIGLGEILWDVFPDGPRFGGAPANFACHAAALGAEAHMVGAVGCDELGRRALAELKQRGVQTGAVACDRKRPTGTVTVTLDPQGHASYTFAADTAWDALAWTQQLAELAAEAAAVCFGTLGQRSECSRRTIQRFVAATPPETLRLLDVNLRRRSADRADARTGRPVRVAGRGTHSRSQGCGAAPGRAIE